MAKRNNGEGTITKRKDGRWEGRYYTGEIVNGKRVRKNVLAKTKAECKEKLEKALYADLGKSRQESYTSEIGFVLAEKQLSKLF